jgi:hypothetical protein
MKPEPLWPQRADANLRDRVRHCAKFLAMTVALAAFFEGAVAVRSALQGGPNFRELREMIRIPHRLGQEIKKAAEEFLDDDDETEPKK